LKVGFQELLEFLKLLNFKNKIFLIARLKIANLKY